MSKRKTLTDPEHTVHPIKIARVGESVFKEPTPAWDVLDAHWTAVRADLARRKLTENGGSTENLALLAIPNSSAEVVALAREQEEELIRLHVKPFVAPNAEPYSTNTGARKHSLGMGMSPHTSYTLDIEIAIANTGTSKGGWVTGVDRDTSYAGDVMLFPQVECVHKGFYLEDLIIAECDKYLEPVNEAMQVSADLPEPSAPSPALLSSAAKTTVSARKAKKLPFVRLQAAEEPTFKRDTVEPKSPKLDTPADPSKPQSKAREPDKTLNVSMGLQAAMEANGIPNSLAELEDVAVALAKHLKITPNPGFLDMYSGIGFDLQKEMLLYGGSIKGRRRPPATNADMLLGLLNYMED
jgi:hypothetical protein